MSGQPRIEGTGRLEAFSDGVFAIVVTLLIIEVHLPEIAEPTTDAMWKAFAEIAPKLISFAISFFTVAIYWVNHHHFFHRVTHSDWKVLWSNNLLLFFLTIVPFTTAVLGDYPTQPVAIFVYAINLSLAAAAFTLMGYYVFFVGRLVPPAIPEAARRAEWLRAVAGAVTYLVAALVGFVFPPIALLIFVAVPIAFIVPNLLGGPDA